MKSTTNLLASVLLGLVTVPTTNKQIKIQYISAPKCTISVPYNLTVWEHSGSAPHELQELAVGRQQHMGTPHPPLTGDSWQLLSHSPTFQNGRTPSECDNIWDFSVNNWDLAANKSEWFNEPMFKVPLGTRGAHMQAAEHLAVPSCSPADLSLTEAVPETLPSRPDCRERHQQGARQSCPRLLGYCSVTTNTALSPNAARTKQMNHSAHICHFFWFTLCYRRASRQTKPAKTN